MVLALVLAAAMIVTSGCGSKKESETEPEEQKAAVETFSGKLTNAMDNVIVVTDEDEVKSFKTIHDTEYDCGDEEHICLYDMVEVTYYKDGSDLFANEVKVTEHKDETLEFKGTVSDINPYTMTVTARKLTVTFTKSKDTEIKGKLTEGDEVEITYSGDINETPHARKIVVTKEKDDPKDKRVNGIVADGLEKTMLLSVDSSHAYRFVCDKNTKVTGISKQVKKGDQVQVTYTGDLNKNPKATEVKVIKKAVAEKVINGTIKSVNTKALVINTGKKIYSFAVSAKTKYSGAKPAAGLKTTVKYSGDLAKSPAALSVYCAKQTASKTKAAQKAQQANKTTPAKKQEKKAQPAPKPAPKPEPKPAPKPEPKPAPKPTPKPTPAPTDVAVEAEGTIIQWVDEDHISCIIEIGQDTRIELAVNDNTDVAAGYLPQNGDRVRIIYMKNGKLLKNIQLIDRPEPDQGDDVNDDQEQI